MAVTTRVFPNLAPGIRDVNDDRVQVPLNQALQYLSGTLQEDIDTEIAAQITTHEAAWASHAEALRGHIAGLTLSNNGTDATNDIDIAVGVATASDQSAVISLGSALTKQLDASWAVGTNAGMRATGAAIANSTYHIFLIRRPDTGVVDIAADTSASGANIASNTNAAYTQKRRIGSIIRSGGAILLFDQVGDTFRLRTAVTDRNNTAAAAAALLTISIPSGIVVEPIIRINLACGASVTCTVALGNAAVGANVNVAQLNTGAGDSNDALETVVPPIFFSNTSAQIYHAQVNGVGTPGTSTVNTLGWVDRRGKND